MTDPGLIDDGFEPDERALCPDDACIGVLDSSGRCKVCGLQGTPAVAGERAASAAEPASIVPDQALPADSVADHAPAAEAADESDDFADRRLCTDPSCIGVLDATGRCKECGRNADDAS